MTKTAKKTPRLYIYIYKTHIYANLNPLFHYAKKKQPQHAANVDLSSPKKYLLIDSPTVMNKVLNE